MGAEGMAEKWFASRSPGWGFWPDSLELGRVWADSLPKAGGANVTLCKAAIAGVPAVLDREKFKKAFAEGLGPAKAFGCGLLRLAPIFQ